MIQAPNYVNPCVQPPQIPASIPASSYNAVKIDVHNPSVNAPGSVPQYAPAMPIYNYPQAQLYTYPQAPQQPFYMPAQPVCPPCPPCVTPVPQSQIPAVAVPAPQAEPAPQVVSIPAAPAPQPVPVIPTSPAEPVSAVSPAAPTATTVEVVPSTPVQPVVDLNSFVAKLASPDYDVQALAMEDIANMVKNEPQKATELLDTKVIDALTNIINADSGKLEGPTAEQIAARDKLLANQKLTDEEVALAAKITPLEQAERNKSYAIFTAAILQKLFADECAKLDNQTVPITELPAAVTIVEQLKNNPNPMVRASALEALSYIQNPAYKKDLETLFKIAQNDQDPSVRDAANKALEKLNTMAA